MSHFPNCGYHLDQYWWECTCGALPTYCEVCGACEQGQDRSLICRNKECPRLRREATTANQVGNPAEAEAPKPKSKEDTPLE